MAVAGCQCSNNNNNADVMSKQNVESNVREFVYPLPTAFEVTEMLNRIEAAYIQAICNAPENVDKYLTEDAKALNLGIYSADMSYSSTYNQHQSVVDFMNVSRKLIDGLDMTAAIDPELPEKVERNENNKDELIKLISESFYDAYDYLNKNNRGAISMLIVAGSWVEGLYITTHISDDTFNNKEMVKIILSQKDPLVKLSELLDKYPNVEYVASLNAELKPLYDIYNNIEEGSITESQLENIKNSVDQIRTKIIE